eukprot:1347716-Amphidinium_carterae.1
MHRTAKAGGAVLDDVEQLAAWQACLAHSHWHFAKVVALQGELDVLLAPTCIWSIPSLLHNLPCSKD